MLNSILFATDKYKYMYELVHDIVGRAASNLTPEEKQLFDAKQTLNKMRKNK
jgi:hypothetical protein